MYFGGMIFFENSFNLITAPERDGLDPAPRLVLDTIIFHTFILMNLFNQINCRVVDSDEKSELNIFRTLFTHFIFIIILGGEFALQMFIIAMSGNKLGTELFGVAPLTANQKLTCWILGACSLIVNIIGK